ncbi:hypothetical protein FW755_03260 [Lonepinella koalarum]|nr:hypothetical protein [Lonepinella koalarum]MDH2927341.1 hypothetical protein [Lonepinella koalarum]TFJ88846.1 hypothetical protein E0709_11835 [Lonepinella koalarum]TYG35597.1 hypothetical protein FW755_03260 [Lonepinella koalarum]
MPRNIFYEDQRLVILRSLVDCGYDANESILNDCLGLYGHDISRDLVKNHLHWLEEQGLVTLTHITTLATPQNHDFLVASITQRGLDVAQGRAMVNGVKRPSPTC